MEKVYVLFGEYSDHSGCKIPRAYSDEQKAIEDLALLKECEPCSSLEWSVVEIPVFGGRNDKPVMR